MTLYKALTNFTFEQVTVVSNGSIIYNGEAWRFDVKEYWLSMVYNISVVYPQTGLPSVIICVGELDEE